MSDTINQEYNLEVFGQQAMEKLNKTFGEHNKILESTIRVTETLANGESQLKATISGLTQEGERFNAVIKGTETRAGNLKAVISGLTRDLQQQKTTALEAEAALARLYSAVPRLDARRVNRVNSNQAEALAQAYAQSRLPTTGITTPQQALQFGLATQQLTAALSRIGSGAGQALQQALAGVAAGSTNFTAKQLQALQAVNQFNSAISSQTSHVTRLNLAWTNFAKFFTIHIAYTAFFKTVQALNQGLRDGIELAKRVEEIRTISQQNQLSSSQFSSGILDISSSKGFGVGDVSGAVYETISNQIATGQQALEFTKQIADFARVTNTSVKESGDSISAVLNAYNLGLGQTEQVAAKLFKQIELGRVRNNELSETFGRVLAPAFQMGVTLDEVAGVLDVLTIRGLRNAEAMTQLNSSINAILSPSEKFAEHLQKLGYASAEEATKILGYTGYLKLMIDTVKKGDLTLGEIATNVRNRRLIQTFIIPENFALLEQQIKKQEQATESFRKAVDIVNNADITKYEQNITRFKNMFIELGKTVGVSVVNAAGAATDALENLGKFKTPKDLEEAAKKTTSGANDALDTFVESLAKKYENATKQANLSLTEFRQQNITTFNKIKEVAELSSKAIENSFYATFTRLGTQLEKLEANANRLEALKNKNLEAKLDFSLRGKNPIDQVSVLQGKFQAERAEGFRLFNTGDLDAGIKKLEVAEATLNRMFALRDKLFDDRNKTIEQIATAKSAGKSTRSLEDSLKSQEEALRRLDYNEFYNVAFNSGKDFLLKTSSLVEIQNRFIDEQLRANQERVDKIGGRRGISIDEAKIALANRRENAEDYLKQLQRYSVLDGKGDYKGADAVAKDVDTLATKIRSTLSGSAEDYADVLQKVAILQAQIFQQSDLQRANKTATVITTDLPERLRKEAEAIKAARKEFEAPFAKSLEFNQDSAFASLRERILKNNTGIGFERELAEYERKVKATNDKILKDNAYQKRYNPSYISPYSSQFDTNIDSKVEVLKSLYTIVTNLYNAESQLNKTLFQSGDHPEIQKYLEARQKNQESLADFQRAISDALSVGAGPDYILKLANDFPQVLVGAIPTLDAILEKSQKALANNNAIAQQIAATTALIPVEAPTSGALQSVGKYLVEAATYWRDVFTPANTASIKASSIVATNYHQAAEDMATASVNAITAAQKVRDILEMRKAISEDIIYGPTFASGGSIGIDSIPAMLSPGEFVVNPSSSSRFFSQIQAINSGFAPKNFASGGATNFGDINVSVNESRSPAQTAREIGTAIRRELNRGSLTLRR